MVELCVSIGCHTKTRPAERQLIIQRIPNIFRRAIAIGRDLDKQRAPGLLKDTHILYQTIVNLVAQSFVLVEFDELL